MSSPTTELSGRETNPRSPIESLAVFGGRPAFSEKLHVGRPNVGDREAFLRRIDAILENRWLTNGGPFVHEFEQRIAEIVGVKHCVAMCNATIALEIAIRALELTGEVIVPSFTFVATAHALQWQQITPVFCDIDPVTQNIDPKKVEKLITPRTSGILGVHLWGRPCAIDELQAIADRHEFALLFDAAHAFGCKYRGRMIGGFGDAEVLSFHATKFINAAEGGAVVTNSDELAAQIRLMKNFGFSGYDSVIYIGTNGKMNELSAACGLTNLESMEHFLEVNRQNFEAYRQGLANLPGVTLMGYDEANHPNYQYIVCEIDAAETHLTRNQLLTVLHAENVLAREYFYPGVHRMEPYRSLFPNADSLLPNTRAIAERILVLPTGTAVTTSDIKTICSIMESAFRQSEQICKTLSRRS